MALRTVGVRLVAEVSDYTRNMKQAGKTTKDFAGEMATAAKSGKLDAVADSALGLGFALGAPATAAIKLAADFDKAMSGVSAATHASAKDLGQLRKAAIQAGKDTSYSATEAADAITELSKAGVATSQILGGGLNGALSLAAAGQIDVGEAAETAASAMTQFRLSGDKVPHVADLLAAGAGKAQGSVSDLGQALNQTGLVASQTGLSIEDTTGTLAAFANAGLTGSDAGTSFKTMLQALQAPSGATKKLMDSLGISAYDAQGKFIGITDLAEQLKTKLGGLSQAQRDAAMAQIFGSDAVRAASILYREGSTGIQSWIGKVNDAGYASETAAKLTDNLAGDVERLKGSLETMAIEAGGGANSGLRVAAKSANALVDQFGQLPPLIGGTVTILAGLGGVLAIGAAGWVKMRRANADALEELRATGPAGDRAAGGLEKTQKWAGRAAVAFAATQVAAAGVSAAFGNDVNAQVDALTRSLTTWAQTGKQGGEAARILGNNFEHLGYDLSTLDSGFWAGLGNGIAGTAESLTGMGNVADESLTHAKERISALDSALTQMVQEGHLATASQTFDLMAAEARKSGVQVDELKKGLPGYTAALETAGTATSKTAGDLGAMGTAAEQSAQQVDDLNKKLNELVGVQLDVDRATIAAKDGQASLTKELLDGKRTLSLNSEEGRKNRSAVLDQVEAIEKLRKSRVDHGMSLDDANAKYVKDIEGLKKTTTAAGFNKKAVDGLVGAYEDIPGQVNTKVSATGTGSVQSLLDNLLIKQEALKKGISVSAAASAFRKNAGYHDGGRTAMVGEHEPAGVVHGQEFVFSAATVRKIDAQSPGFLDEAQATGQLPGYRDGGRVATWPFPVTVAKTKIPSEAEAMAAVAGDFGKWPSSPGAQRGDSGVWRKIVGLVKSSGIPYEFGNGYRPGDPLWHGSGRAVDFMGYNQDRLAQFFMGRQGQVLELIHRTKNRDYGLTRGHYNAMPTQWPLHKNHLHVAMKNGGMITEPIMGVGASGTTYQFGENYQHERVTPMGGGGLGGTIQLTVINAGVIGSQREAENFLVGALDNLKRQGRV